MCVSGWPCIEQWWGRVRLGEQILEILDTEHNTSDVTFLSTPSAKIRPWTHGTTASEDSFEAGISVLIPGIIRLNWTKRCCPPISANISESRSPAAHAWLCCDSTDVRSFSRDLESSAKIHLTGSLNWMIGPMMHWTESYFVMERGKMLRWKAEDWWASSQWLCQLEEEGRSAETNGSLGTFSNDSHLYLF